MGGGLLSLPGATLPFSSLRFHSKKLLQVVVPDQSISSSGDGLKFHKFHGVRTSLRGSSEVADSVKSFPKYVKAHDFFDEDKLDVLPHVQTLGKYPKDNLVGKVAMVRFDADILLGDEITRSCQYVGNAVYTIKYLHGAGAKIVLVGDWGRKNHFKLLNAVSAADILQSVLQQKVVAVPFLSSGTLLQMAILEKADIFLLENLSQFKEEVANCSKFAKLLSSGVDIFVNDSFSVSHKVLASTVGITQFCSVCLAGFHFEHSLCQLKKAVKANKKPFFAIIGGGNLCDKAMALHFLASRCDGMIFVGMMLFQILHALGHPVPSVLIEPGARDAALALLNFAHDKSITVVCPKDFWCINKQYPKHRKIFSAHSLMDGWLPVDLGPRSLDEINSSLTNCKKIIWISPVTFKFSSNCLYGASYLCKKLDNLSKRGCDITIMGNMASKSLIAKSSSLHYDIIHYASVVWEFLKGRRLHGIIALDRAYPFEIDWNATYNDPIQPLVVDIGSGNGKFLFGMARRRNDLNFLGLEINKKLVRRCLDSVHQSGTQNVYFVETNATSTFRSIVSTYPGELVLVSIQCPNPDFNNPEHRWRMLQKPLVEAVVDLLAQDGKVFLQSDIQAVAVRMKELFLAQSKGNLTLQIDQYNLETTQRTWLDENPFGVRSDWEQHVLDRGATMYRLMLSKTTE